MTRREGSQGARDPKSKSLLCPLACEFARQVGSRAHGTERHAWTLVAELASQGALARGSGPPSALSLPPPPLSLSPFFLSSQPHPSSARRLPAWDKGRRGDWPASEFTDTPESRKELRCLTGWGPSPTSHRSPPRRVESAALRRVRLAPRACGAWAAGGWTPLPALLPRPRAPAASPPHPSGPAPLRTLLLNSSWGGKFATRDPPRW